MKKLFVSICLFATTVGAMAQIDADDKQLFNHVGLSAGIGLDGFSIEAATTICPYVQMRAGVSFFPTIKVKNIGVDISSAQGDWQRIQGEAKNIKNNFPADAALVATADKVINNDLPSNVKLDGKLNMTNFKMLFDLYPTKTSPWRLTVGFYAGKSQIVECYTTNCQAQFEALSEYNQNLANRHFEISSQGQNLYSYTFPGEIGVKVGDYLVKPNGPQANACIKVNGFKPYLGIGSGRAISNKHRFSFAWDLGLLFWGAPTIYVQDQKIDENTNLNGGGDVIKDISKLKVYPTLSFRVNGRIL